MTVPLVKWTETDGYSSSAKSSLISFPFKSGLFVFVFYNFVLLHLKSEITSLLGIFTSQNTEIKVDSSFYMSAPEVEFPGKFYFTITKPLLSNFAPK